MYHDPGYASDNDRVQVQVSTNGGSAWTDVGPPVSRYAATAAWTEHTVSLSAYIGQTDVRIALHGITVYGNDCHIDDLRVTYTATGSCTVNPCTAASGPQRVPYSVTPTGITTADHGDTGIVTWDVTNCPSVGYHIIWGFGRGLSGWTVDGSRCDVGTLGSYEWADMPDPSGDTKRFLWFLVVGNDGAGTEGSWGLTSGGQERGGVSPSGICSTAKRTEGDCATP